MNLIRHSRRVFLQGAALAIAAPADDPPSPGEQADMLSVARAFMEEHEIPGLSVAVAREGELLYAKGFGFADRGGHELVTSEHLFRIASVSKPITSVAVFRLIEQGKLRLDDRIFGDGSVLADDFGKPPYREFICDIRLHHLLTHTAGGWQNDGNDPMFRNPAMNHHDLIAWTIEKAPLQHPPGERFAYSNFGYCVIGRIIEKVTGRAYDDHVRGAVLRRCGVTGMRIAGNTLEKRAPGEVVYYGAGRQDPYGMNVGRMDSHGGWLASASNLALFAARFQRILQPASVREMTTATKANEGYAKGWNVNRAPNWWHSGSLPGTTSIMVHTASGFSWAALANSREAQINTGGAMDQMMWNLVRQVKSWKP